ncbi:MAG TPA: response regulator [Planctomycetaceae bacterium]|nr:response regulator [Planctomycetaceae bacterium]
MATILIVDDDATNRQLLLTLLGYGGHRLIESANGADALKAAHEHSPDLIITDVLMPGMDGYEVVRQLRQDPALRDTAIIFYTAHYNDREARELASACGVKHFLSKPAEPELILSTVNAVLDRACAPAEPRMPDEFDRQHLRLVSDKLTRTVDDLQEANLRQAALMEINLRLGSERDPQLLLEALCRSARELLGVGHAAVGVLREGGTSLHYFFTDARDGESTVYVGVPCPDHGILAEVVQDRRPQRRANLMGNPQSTGLPEVFPPVRHLLVVPLVSLSRVYGWVSLSDMQHEFTSEDEVLASILAAQVGRVYENGRLYAQLMRRVSELDQEIARRVEVEDSLRVSEERFVKVFQSSPAAIAILRMADGRVLDVNESFLRMHGCTREAAIGRMSSEFGLPGEGETWHEFAAGLQVQGSVRDLEVGFISSAGEPHVALTSVELIELGGEPCLISLALDITERQRNAESLRSAVERLELASRGTNEGLWDARFAAGRPWDDPRTEFWWSPRFKELLGFRPDEFPNHLDSWSSRLHPDDRDAVLNALRAHIETGVPFNLEYRLRVRTGEFRWFAGRGQARWDKHGRLIRMAGSIRDLTEQKKLEEQFRQSQKLEAIGRLAGGIAHDFNNLLTAIMGYAGMMLDEVPASDPLHEGLAEITRAGERAAILTRQLLAFSRKQVVSPIVLDLQSVVKDMERMLRRVIGENIELVTRAAEAPLLVKVDPGQLEQVLMNLVVNARDAMPGGGRLTVETERVTIDEREVAAYSGGLPGEFVRLSVADTGVGISDDIRARLFEPFFTTKQSGQGTGMGLATVFGIAQQNGGWVEVESEPGAGAAFRVYWPRPAEQQPTPVVPRAHITAPRGREAVLVVEDEGGVRGLVCRILRSGGYDVLEARDGVEALLLCEDRNRSIQLLVSDLVMPAMSGPELARRASEHRPELKVLYISGYMDAEQIPPELADSGVPLLQKPFSPQELLRRVRELLDATADIPQRRDEART